MNRFRFQTKRSAAIIFSFHSTKTSSGREKAASESPSWVVMVLVSPALPDPDPVLLPRRVERKLWIGINLDTAQLHHK